MISLHHTVAWTGITVIHADDVMLKDKFFVFPRQVCVDIGPCMCIHIYVYL